MPTEPLTANECDRAKVSSRSSRAAGFSLLEVLVVAAMIITMTALSLPKMTTMLATARMRGAMGDLSTLFQNGRNVAVKKNTMSWVRFQLSNGHLVAYVDNAANPTGLTASTPQLVMPLQLTKVAAPTSSPTPLDGPTCGSSSTPDTIDDTYFNQLGIPCQYSGGSCSAQAFAYYFTYQSGLTGTNWAGLCVSPAGRLKAWYWDGSAWSN